MKKILITGGGGYFARKLIHFIQGQGGYDITVSVRKSPKDSIGNNLNIIIGDLADPLTYRELDDKFDLVVHCASNTDHFADQEVSYRDNVIATKFLLDHLNGQFEAFIYISSEAVFLGAGALGSLSSNAVIPKANISTYSMMKKMAEGVIQEYSTKFPRARFITLRPRIIWGGDQAPALVKLKSALDRGTFVWVENGGYLTSTTHYLNLCNAILNSFTKGVNGKAYFITDGPPITFRAFINKIAANDSRLDKAPSIPRWLAYCLALIGDGLYILSGKKIHPPISRSLYYLSLSSVVLDANQAYSDLGFIPEEV